MELLIGWSLFLPEMGRLEFINTQLSHLFPFLTGEQTNYFKKNRTIEIFVPKIDLEK